MGEKRIGTHLLLDAWEAPARILDDEELVREALVAAVEAGGVTLIDTCVHKFSPYGVTATATLAESHAAVHTWPEYGFFSADFFFCGRGDPQAAKHVLLRRLGARRSKVTVLVRGFGVPAEAHVDLGVEEAV